MRACVRRARAGERAGKVESSRGRRGAAADHLASEARNSRSHGASRAHRGRTALHRLLPWPQRRCSRRLRPLPPSWSCRCSPRLLPSPESRRRRGSRNTCTTNPCRRPQTPARNSSPSSQHRKSSATTANGSASAQGGQSTPTAESRDGKSSVSPLGDGQARDQTDEEATTASTRASAPRPMTSSSSGRNPTTSSTCVHSFPRLVPQYPD